LEVKGRDVGCMTDSTKNAIPPKPTKSQNSNSSVHILVQIQIRPKFNLNLYRKIHGDLSFPVRWISGLKCFQWNLSSMIKARAHLDACNLRVLKIEACEFRVQNLRIEGLGIRFRFRD